MKIYILIAFMLIAIISCKNAGSSSMTDPAIDSSGLQKMRSYFHQSDSGLIDPTVEIDTSYLIKIFNDTNGLWNSINSANPINLKQNATGSFS